MAAHRYWRLHCLFRPNTDGCYSLTELEMFTAASPTVSVCTGGTASASSINSGAWAASNAFDGVKLTDSGWASVSDDPAYQGRDEWLMYDFGAGNEKDITSIAITSRNSIYSRQTPLMFQMDWSDNGTDWRCDSLIMNTPAWTAGTTRQFDLIPIETVSLIPTFSVAEIPTYSLGANYIERGVGRLAGIARTDTDAVENAVIRVFDSTSGNLIDTTKSNSVGAWQFDNLKEHTEHFITASHPLLTWENVVSSQRYPVDPAPLLLPRVEGGERFVLGLSAWGTVASWTVTTSTSWPNPNGRLVIPTAARGTKVRLTLVGGPSSSSTITSMYVGVPEYPQSLNFKSAPSPVTVGGLSTFTIAANATVVSDPITITIPDKSGLLISFYATSGNYTATTTIPSGWGGYTKSGSNESNNLTVTGYNLTSSIWLITKVEFFTDA